MTTTCACAHAPTLHGPSRGVNDIVPTDSAIPVAEGDSGSGRFFSFCRDLRVPRARTQASTSPGSASSPRCTVPMKMSSRSVETSRDDLGPQHVPDGRRPEVFDQHRGDDARMLLVVGRGGDAPRRRRRRRRRRGPCREGWRDARSVVRVATVWPGPRRSTSMPRSAAKASSLGPAPVTPSAPGGGPAWARRWPATACGSPCSTG